MEYHIQIKNLVCSTCVNTVQQILNNLNIPYKEVSLGEAVLMQPLSLEQQKKLQEELGKFGFQLLEEKNRQLVNSIKSLVIKAVYEETGSSEKNLSQNISTKLSYDYSYLSNLFSALEGISIRDFHNKLKIERTKELLEYGELNMNEIAFQLGYNSAGYLSTKFKKATGLTPSQYQKQHLKERKPLDVL